MKEFAPASPQPYIDQLKGLAVQVASAAGLPEAYFGITHENPVSADAIRAGEARLVKKAERRQAGFGLAWQEVGLLVLTMLGHPDQAAHIGCSWRDPATPTQAATADATTKLVAAGVLPPTSTVTMTRVGLTPAEQATVLADWADQPSTAMALANAVTRQEALP
jgi:hypothetical protein